MGDSLKVYGFGYAFAGWRSTFRVFANSEAEAKEHAAAMAAHEFVGELMPVDKLCALPQSSDSAAARLDAN
jgi:hypothetical protein